jgi:hypothetical protein
VSKKTESARNRPQRGSIVRKSAAQARKLYDEGVLIRGEVGKRGKNGKLPPGKTHEIAKGEVVRVRYSIV